MIVDAAPQVTVAPVPIGKQQHVTVAGQRSNQKILSERFSVMNEMQGFPSFNSIPHF